MLQFFSILPWRNYDNVVLPSEDVLQHTTRFFLWETKACEVIAIGGEMLPSLAGPEVYLWLSLAKGRWPRSLLKAGARLANAYLQNLPWTPKAECALEAKQNQAFLRHCGFRQEAQYSDRLLFSRM